MRFVASLLAVILAAPVLASAQESALGSDLTGYRRFVVYPHLQKGWESMQRGEREQALKELERAHDLAPESTTVALHLAAAYRKFGELNRAESLLRQQLARTPDDVRVRGALNELRTPPQTALTRPSASPCTDPTSAGCGTSTPSASTSPRTERAAGSPAVVEAPRPPEPKSGAVVAGSPTVAAGGVTSPARVRKKVAPPVAPPDPSTELRSAFALALQTRRFDEALRQADSLIASATGGAGLVDELSYKFVDAGAPDHAIRMLLRAYPFTTGGPAERDTLMQRLAVLIEQQRAGMTEADLLPLRAPLDAVGLRSRQAAMWANMHDCDTVRAVLADMSSEYGHDDFMRLGDCSTAAAPSVAQQAYARAHALQPGGRASRALGYQAYAAGDYRAALDAWRSVAPQDLTQDDALSAVTTALAAGENRIAGEWLQSYREHGHALDRRYWSLLAQSYTDTDTPAAIAALEHAIALRPELDDYLRLARLERSPDRQVRWLERAAELDRANGSVLLELAYAYRRAGREARALSALERAAVLDPDNMNVQIELGYAHWAAGHAALAQRALERALRADPSNLILAKQLVYVTQRLKQNDKSRWYAEQLLDAPGAFVDSPTAESDTAADRRFAMQRLHEDLGRRVTISLDGFSGTHVGTATTAPAGNRYSSYSQLEADIRLGSPAIRNGSTVSAYARLFGDGGQLRRPVPTENAMLGVGLRWKPWSRQVIYLAAENQIGLEDHDRRDVLLRASASFLNGGRLGDDWHASHSGWVSTNLYLDAAHYLKADYSAFTADYRASYHRKLVEKQTLEPYAHVQFNSAWTTHVNRDVRAGLGVRWNLWHGGSTYDADPHKLSLGLEFQQAFETYLPDRNGVFVTLGSRW